MDKSRIESLARQHDYSQIAEELTSLHPADIAEFLEHLDSKDQAAILRELDASAGGDALSELDSEDREELLEEIDPAQLTRLVKTLPADDATDILSEAPDDKKDKVLHNLSPEDSAEIKELLKYEDDSASGIMDPELLAVQEIWSVGQTLDALKVLDTDEPIYYVYVVDYLNRLVGFVSLQNLIKEDDSRPVGSIMDRHVISVQPDTDQEEVAQLVQKYDLMAIPVVDKDGKLKGRITVDDIIDVIEQETTEDFFRLAGVLRWGEDTRSMFRTAMQRLPWLIVALIGSLVGAAFQKFYSVKLGADYFTVFVPFVVVIAAMGGNIGIQSCTTVVRGLATGDIDDNILGVVVKQVWIATIVGIVCAAIAAMAALFISKTNPILVSCVVGLSLFCATLIAASAGALAPAICKKIGIDPTAASGPFVTVSIDVIGIAIYFTIAIISLNFIG